MLHRVKSWTQYFQPIIDGIRTFDVRLNDRNYQAGDYIILEEYDFLAERYTGRRIGAYVPYVLQGHCAAIPNFGDIVILSLIVIDKDAS